MKLKSDVPFQLNLDPIPFNSAINKSVIYSKLTYELRVFVLIMIAVLNQHINLFEFHFDRYNFSLILYIFLISLFKVLQRLKEVLSILFPINNFGLIGSITCLQFIGTLVAIYLFFNIYDHYSWKQVIFLGY